MDCTLALDGPFGVLLKPHNSVRLFFFVKHKIHPPPPNLVAEHLGFDEEGCQGHNGGYRITGQPGNHLSDSFYLKI